MQNETQRVYHTNYNYKQVGIPSLERSFAKKRIKVISICANKMSVSHRKRKLT